MERSAVAARWGALIHRKRHEQEPTLLQVDLAARLGVSQATISDWERGGSVPRPGTQAALIDLLDITADELADIYSGAAA